MTTNPKREYELVIGGGEGLEKERREVHGKEVEHVRVTGTRGKYIPGEKQEDLRVLRPLEAYGCFRKDGRLESHEPSEHDTDLQKLVKEAGLVRIEIIVLILYTGMFQTMLYQ